MKEVQGGGSSGAVVVSRCECECEVCSAHIVVHTCFGSGERRVLRRNKPGFTFSRKEEIYSQVALEEYSVRTSPQPPATCERVNNLARFLSSLFFLQHPPSDPTYMTVGMQLIVTYLFDLQLTSSRLQPSSKCVSYAPKTTYILQEQPFIISNFPSLPLSLSQRRHLPKLEQRGG